MDEIKLPYQMNLTEFTEYINQPPPNTALSDDGTHTHIPISLLEDDLCATYCGLVQHRIKSVTQTFGGYTMVVRLKVFHPVINQWLKYDGVASVPIESIQAGEYAGTTKIMYVNEPKLAVSACYTEGIKNAAKKIGKRFGSDNNREVTQFKAKKKTPDEHKKNAVIERVGILIGEADSIAALNGLLPNIGDNEELLKAFSERLKQLKPTTKKPKK